MPEPADSLNEVLGAMADRVGKYADIWQDAARRNARQDYSAADAVNDMQQTFALGLRDAADVGAAMLAVFGNVARAADDDSDARAERAPKPAAAKKTTPAKKAAAKKVPVKKATAKRTRPSK